jgi:hypothetical protein
MDRMSLSHFPLRITALWQIILTTGLFETEINASGTATELSFPACNGIGVSHGTHVPYFLSAWRDRAAPHRVKTSAGS